MKVLVVGGAGYVGGAVTDILKYMTHYVKVYDNLTFEDDYRKEGDYIFGDVTDYKKLRPLLEWADAVIWLAGIVGDAACQINPERTEAVNKHAVKFLSENFDGRIIFPSTCSVYGAQDGLLTEDSPTNPLSLYASTKLDAEDYLKGKNVVIFRLGTLFGVGDRFSRIRLDLVVNTLTAKAYTEGKLTVFGGEQYRPLLHVRDAARAMCEALTETFTGIYNLSTTNIKISELAEKVRDLIPCIIVLQEMKFEDSRNYRVSAEKYEPYHLSQKLHPTHTIEDGIKQIQELFEQERIKDPLNPRYNNYGYLSR